MLGDLLPRPDVPTGGVTHGCDHVRDECRFDGVGPDKATARRVVGRDRRALPRTGRDLVTADVQPR